MAKSAKTKLRISITIIPLVNSMLENVSKRSGISKSMLVEMALKSFLAKQLESDTKKLAKIEFDDLPSEEDWLSIQSEIA